MATIKVSIELDDASLQREIREAAATTKREFDKLDAGSNLQKKAKTAFDQIGKDAHSATAKMQSELEAFSKRGFFKTIADNAKSRLYRNPYRGAIDVRRDREHGANGDWGIWRESANKRHFEANERCNARH